MAKPIVEIAADPQGLAKAGVRIFLGSLENRLRSRPWVSVILSGGKTPRPFFEALAREPAVPRSWWEKIHFFWSDERAVPPDHPESNYRFARETLLSRIPVPEKNIHRIRAELGAVAAAEEYEEELRSVFALKGPLERPPFDLAFLGLGPDGHTASLFPDGKPGISIGADEPGRLVIAPWVEHLRDHRISLTPRALNGTDLIVFLVSGAEKAAIVASVLDGTDRLHPANVIQPANGRIIWLIDRAAAGALKSKPG